MINNNINNEVKKVNMRSVFNPLDLVVHDEKMRDLCFKKFTEFSEEDMNLITWCNCSIISKVFDNVKFYYAQLEICDCVYVQKRLSSLELKLISKYAPALVSNFSKALVPVKFLSYEINFDNGKNIRNFRTYNVIAFICDSVYIGTGKKRDSKVPNGALNDQQLKVICMENAEGKTSIRFVDTGKEDVVIDDEDDVQNTSENESLETKEDVKPVEEKVTSKK